MDKNWFNISYRNKLLTIIKNIDKNYSDFVIKKGNNNIEYVFFLFQVKIIKELIEL